MRKIIHIDMDAFYASIEERDNPKLKGKPIIVGGRPDERGVVATCSYAARKYGIHSAMSSKTAYALCPEAIFIHPRHEVYEAVSLQIRAVFRKYTEKIEPLSWDEAFLDVTINKLNMDSAVEVAMQIKDNILKETGLTSSAGVSYNKFLAKIASDYKKPNGLTVITPEEAQSLLNQLPIEKFFGVGKVTAHQLKKIGIQTGLDLRRLEKTYLQQVFHKRGEVLYDFARGIDYREVENHRIRKSIGAETTFEVDVALNSAEIKTYTEALAREVSNRLLKHEKKAKTITIKIKFEDFTQITRSLTVQEPFSDVERIDNYSTGLIDKVVEREKKIRLLGITTSNLVGINEDYFVNISLFD